MRPFLYNLFSDRLIIKLGPPLLQKPVAWLISSLRAGKTREMYGQIGGKSPLNDITAGQAKALEKALNEKYATQFRVYVGMRYWHPFIEDTVRRMRGDAIDSVLAISLYPHYSVATTGSALGRFDEVIGQYPIESFSIASWYNHPVYIDALVEVIEGGLGESGGDAHVLFSAHSLPSKIIESGDPYVSQIEHTIGEVTRKIDIKWHLSYQSKSGPVRWIGPATGDKIKELSRKGVRNLLIVPISFVSDHIETLYEIDILYKEEARRVGIKMTRTESLNVRPSFINALEDIAISGLKESGWIR